MDNFGLGLVGAALEGGYLLSPLIVDTVEQTGLRLRAIYDTKGVDAQEVEMLINSKYDRLGIPQDLYLTNDLQHMFNDFMLDVMLVTVPAEEHRAIIETALSGFGKVALTGPLALDLEDAQAIVDASREHPLLVNLPRRFEAGWQKVTELLSSGVIGELQFVNLRAFLPETNYLRLWQRTQDHRDDLFLGQLCGYMDALNWYAGAACVQLSAIGNIGKHDLDNYDPNGIFTALFHQLPIRWRSLAAPAQAGTVVDNFPADEYVDRLAAQMRFSNGVLGSLTICSSGPTAADAEDLELIGNRGRIWFNAAEGKLSLHFWNGSDSERMTGLGDLDLPLTKRLNAAFLAQLPAYIQGEPPAATAVEAAEALKMALAVLDSMHDNGRPVLMGLEIEGEQLPAEESAAGAADKAILSEEMNLNDEKQEE
ncbi:MAG: Gfo/Idh/MocA family oxidoreductase [Anaerolineae bacterium]|jgi:predicted dehydrogenase|nr:Gfo/Idh/MocA family oxidoreductase [Anaerolineae bacterium]